MFLITGASGGIGNQLFNELAKENKVIGLANKKILKSIGKGIPLNVDLLNHEEIYKIVEKFRSELKRVIVIQLAVSSFDGLIANYPLEKIRQTFELNLVSNIILVQALLPIMISQKWGRIIHCSSIVGNEGANGAGIYASSKSALIGYSKTLSKEYGRFGITSNILELGYFENGLINTFNKEKINQIINQTSSKRLGIVDDIIAAIEFIEKSNFYNGEILKLNGGR
tara:strand:- start:4946 stop:5623 length:678 start_codon:yes stop_codon:yes gene_type:complete